MKKIFFISLMISSCLVRSISTHFSPKFIKLQQLYKTQLSSFTRELALKNQSTVKFERLIQQKHTEIVLSESKSAYRILAKRTANEFLVKARRTLAK